jgi:hypothetical protein
MTLRATTTTIITIVIVVVVATIVSLKVSVPIVNITRINRTTLGEIARSCKLENE